MADLTDSFCERCGTRYAFTASSPRGFSLKGARMLAKGLRNFVLTDGQSMADAIENARLETSHETSSRVTEAFHATFNFCMGCRQYACSKCWNVRVGACLSCAPETNVRSVSPQDHLIVRTPVARWDGDWAITPDGPVQEPLLGQDSPAPTKPQGVAAQLASLTHPIPATEWPTTDLAEGPFAEAARVKTGRGTHQNKQAGPADGSLWAAGNMTEAAVPPGGDLPAPTESMAAAALATPEALPDARPELALTPQERMLIEAELAHSDDDLLTSMYDVRHEAPSPRELAAQWLSIRQGTPGAPYERLPQDRPIAPVFRPAVPAQPTPPAQAIPTAPMPPAPILPATPPAPAPAPAPRNHEPIVGRILGRHDAAAGAAKPRAQKQPAGEPGLASAWPHPTPWAERPADALGALPHPDQRTSVPSNAASESVPAAAIASPPATEPHREPVQSQRPVLAQTHVRPARVPAPAAKPFPVVEVEHETAAAAPAGRPSARILNLDESAESDTREPNDARGAAAVRLLAVTHSRSQRDVAAASANAGSTPAGQPAEGINAAQQGLFELAPQQPARRSAVAGPAVPIWPAADTEVTEALSRRSAHRPAQPAEAPEQTQRPVSPAESAPQAAQARQPWPPLGASLPAHQVPDAAWSGPDEQLPPALAALQIRPPVMAEMWAQSSEDVVNRGSVRVCHHCALPVSTQARFCRRCGSPQA